MQAETQKNPISLDRAVLVGNWVLYVLTLSFAMATGIWMILPSHQVESLTAIWSVGSWSFQTGIGLAVVLLFLKIQKTPNQTDQNQASD